MLQEGVASDYRAWIYYGYMSIQEAVSTVLLYYRTVMAQYFAYCRNMSIDYYIHKEAWVEIYTLMNSFEIAVWENDSYQLRAMQQEGANCNKNAQTPTHNHCQQTKKYNVNNTFVDEESKEATLISETQHQHNSSMGAQPNQTDNNSTVTVQHLMMAPINEQIEEEFSAHLRSCSNDCVKGNFSNNQTEHGVHIIHDEQSQTMSSDNAETKKLEDNFANASEHENVSELSSSMCVDCKHNTCDDAEDFPPFDLQYDVILFEDAVKRKRCRLSKKLPTEHTSMLEATIKKCQQQIEARQLRTSDAVIHVGKLVKFLEADFGNMFDT